jgi:cyanophycin synthetase
MELVEIRDLDGPNVFALEPTIKLEVIVEPEEQLGIGRQQYIAEHTNHYVSSNPVHALLAVVTALHSHLKLPSLQPTSHEMDSPGHTAVCFPWSHRSKARAIARVAFDLVAGERIERLSTRLIQAIEAEYDEDEPDEPTWVRDSERRIPTAAITGTNGKTTTTRLLAHILRTAGKRVGWSSSSGVYIEGELVIEGDYTGHGGARRVLSDPGIDCAVLETARGGILLRGLGYESNDVGVFLNVSEDHLNLHGVRTVETLAKVKATVVRTTHPDGLVVLNAEDPLVLAQRAEIRAELMLFSQDPDNAAIMEHSSSGGRSVVLSGGAVVLHNGQQRTEIVPIAEVPLTYGGMARHMIENALAATAAAIGMGVDRASIAVGMRSFHPDRDHNAGRLNVYDLDDFKVIVDFAHNESGLRFLIDFARNLIPDSSRLTAIIGTAGDRQDSVFVGLGRIAGQTADRVVIKGNPGYLRGRTLDETMGLMRQGIQESGASGRQGGEYSSELEGVIGAINEAQPGEVVVVMCVEDYPRITDELVRRGAREWMPSDA